VSLAPMGGRSLRMLLGESLEVFGDREIIGGVHKRCHDGYNQGCAISQEVDDNNF
jgi:hypothetical protein